MNPLDFLKTALDLTTSSTRRPRQTNLRRAVSTPCYAVFHCLANCCADMVVGGTGSDRSRPAWRQTYRALDHRTARKRCENQNLRQFPVEIQDLANVFVDMQKKRHSADYDPHAVFSKPEVVQGIHEADTVIRGFPGAARKDRRVAGFWLWQVRDMDEAVAWVKRCPNPMPGPSEIEIRPVFGRPTSATR